MPESITGTASGSSTRNSTLKRAHAHAATGLDEARVDALQSDHGVAEHGQDRVEHERDDGGPER